MSDLGSSSPPVMYPGPSSLALRARHDEIVSHGPGLAKGRFRPGHSVQPPTFEQYGAEFRARRKLLGLTQEDVAKEWLVQPRLVRRWERGERMPPLNVMDWLRALCLRGGCTGTEG